MWRRGVSLVLCISKPGTEQAAESPTQNKRSWKLQPLEGLCSRKKRPHFASKEDLIVRRDRCNSIGRVAQLLQAQHLGCCPLAGRFARRAASDGQAGRGSPLCFRRYCSPSIFHRPGERAFRDAARGFLLISQIVLTPCYVQHVHRGPQVMNRSRQRCCRKLTLGVSHLFITGAYQKKAENAYHGGVWSNPRGQITVGLKCILFRFGGCPIIPPTARRPPVQIRVL